MARIYKLEKGMGITDEILRIAKKEKIRTARVEAIGGVNKLELAFFNHEEKKYEKRKFNEFMEVTSLLGNITLKDGKPFLHMHGTFGRRDSSVVGGHLVSGSVFPMLEAIITPTKNRAKRRFDEEMGLNVIYKVEA
ncbi:MAG: DUF296 domain-containing protein [Nitrososphaerales archaeon]|nr:DUF296 domain-containing protein [Nitrososphaerales archaeon]